MKIIYCADIIARMHNSNTFVVIERMTRIPGFALPGGKQDPGETLSETAGREFLEETGMCFVPEGVFGTYAEYDRDPRGHYVSTVFYGRALGTPKDETGKTRVWLFSPEEFRARKDRFVFDHFDILQHYLERSDL